MTNIQGKEVKKMIKKIIRYLWRFILDADPVIADATSHLTNKEYYEIDGYKLARIIKNHAGKRDLLQVKLVKLI